ncbi:MAG: mechanosensitive ion channel family protein [Desulfurivibrionaceae bacterium]
MDTILKFFPEFTLNVLIKTGLRVTLVLVFAWIAVKLINKFLEHLKKGLIKKSELEGEPPTESQKRVETLIRLLKQGALLALWLTAGLVILKELGIEIGPILASAGILGLAIGFGAQNLVRDIISGFFIILENQIRVGDVAIINGTGGLVDKINFRTTVLRDLSGVVHVFPNGTINTLSNMTNEWSAYVFELGVAYKENTDRVVEVIREVGRRMREDEKYGEKLLEDIEIFGVDKFGDSAVVIKGRLKTKPIRQWEVGREFLRRIKLAFDEHDIEIPFPAPVDLFRRGQRPFRFAGPRKRTGTGAGRRLTSRR